MRGLGQDLIFHGQENRPGPYPFFFVKGELSDTDTSALEHQIDNMVYELCNMRRYR